MSAEQAERIEELERELAEAREVIAEAVTDDYAHPRLQDYLKRVAG